MLKHASISRIVKDTGIEPFQSRNQHIIDLINIVAKTVY